MQIGLFLTAQFPPGRDALAETAQVLRQAQVAEAAGLDSIFVGHHYLARTAFMQPIPLLGWLAAHTRRIKLGFGVFLGSLVSPVALAEELATLDVLSGGRLIVGLGAGYREVEYKALGIPYETRFRRLEETVQLLRALWSGEPVTHQGLTGELAGAKLVLRPVQQGGPPLWLGAFGPQGIARSVKLDTPWLIPPDGDRAELVARFADYRTQLVAQGRDLRREYPLLREVCVAPTRAEAERRALEHLVPLYRQYKRWDAAQKVSIDDLVNSYACVGTPDEVAAQLRWYGEELGATHVIGRASWPGMPAAEAEEGVALLGEAARKIAGVG